MPHQGKQIEHTAPVSNISPDAGRLAPLLAVGRSERVTRIALPIAIVALTFLAFAPSLNAVFVNWDDEMMLRGNPMITGLSGDRLAAMFSTGYMGHYQPLAWLTLTFDNLVWGLDRPGGFHLTNVALHACGAVLFYFLARRLLGLALSRSDTTAQFAGATALCWAAAAASVLFSVHPLRVESVAWVTERRDVLSGIFFIAALIAYLRAVSPGCTAIRHHGWHLGALLFLFISLLCKAWGMALPAVLIVLDCYPLRRFPAGNQSWRSPDSIRVLAQKAPFFLMVLPFAYLAILAQGVAAWGVMSLARYPISARATQALYGIAFYPLRTLLPRDLSAIYEVPRYISILTAPFSMAACVSVLLTVAFVVFRRRYPAGLAAWICYLVIIAPVLGAAQSGVQLVADRYSYLSCLGFPLLAAGALLATSKNSPTSRAPLIAITSIVILALGALTFRECGYWKDSITLWTKTVRVAPESPIAHVNLGNAYQAAGDPVRASPILEQAVRLDRKSGMAWQSLAIAYSSQRRFAEGERAFQEAQRYFVDPRETDLELALLYLRWDKPDQAEPLLESTSRSAKLRPRSLAYLGALHRQQKKFQQAVRELEEASALDPELGVQIWPELELARKGR